MKKINHKTAIIDGSFGMWISALFSALVKNNPGWSVEEYREAFFCLIEELLSDGKLRFQDPKKGAGRNDIFWEVSPKEIVASLEASWPANVVDVNDADLNVYFYTIPAVLWVGTDGKIYSS